MAVAAHPEHAALWHRVAEGEPTDWDALFGGYAAVVDFPACGFYAELAARYPDAQVVLTVRDPDRAWERVRDTIHRLSTAADSPLPAELRRAFEVGVWQRIFRGAFEDRANATAVFAGWPDEVRRRIPADRLLVWDVADGWPPLCGFLKVEVPDQPFPS